MKLGEVRMREERKILGKMFFNRLSCDCDDEFYTCLKNSGDAISAYFVGNMYFNLIDTKCYKLEHPVTGCGEK